jgi:hypothetical protein
MIPPVLAGAAGKALAVLVVVVAAAITGYLHGRAHEQGVQAEIRLKEEVAFTKRLREVAERDRRITTKVQGELAAARHERDEYREAFRKKLAEAPRETLIDVPATPSAPAAEPSAIRSVEVPARQPIPRLSAIACGLWNDALASGATVAERAGWLAGANPCTGAVEVEDALLNLQANAKLLGECRAREQATHKWMEEVGLTKIGGE